MSMNLPGPQVDEGDYQQQDIAANGMDLEWDFSSLSQESLNRQGGGSDWKVWCEDSWGTACLVFSSLAMDRVNISLIDPTVLCF